MAASRISRVGRAESAGKLSGRLPTWPAVVRSGFSPCRALTWATRRAARYGTASHRRLLTTGEAAGCGDQRGAGQREAEREAWRREARPELLTLAEHCLPGLGPQEEQVAPEAVDCSYVPGSSPESQGIAGLGGAGVVKGRLYCLCKGMCSSAECQRSPCFALLMTIPAGKRLQEVMGAKAIQKPKLSIFKSLLTSVILRA